MAKKKKLLPGGGVAGQSLCYLFFLGVLDADPVHHHCTLVELRCHKSLANPYFRRILHSYGLHWLALRLCIGVFGDCVSVRYRRLPT